MNTLQKTDNRATKFVDYIPAELRKNKEWIVCYYVKNPFTKKLERKRVRVKRIKGATERLKFARKLVSEINSKLERGYNPFMEQEAARSFALLIDVIDQYLIRLKKQVKDGALRSDTARSYKSYIINLVKYMKKKETMDMYCLNFDMKFVQGFMDYIYYDRDNSNRTYNNYLLGIRMFVKYLLEREFISLDPTAKMSTKRNGAKKREMIPRQLRAEISKYLQANNPEYLTLCLATYYCFIRRTELTKIRVCDVNIHKGYIIVNSDIAKNHKTEPVTIPKEYIPYIANHISRSNNSDYLFSADNYRTGNQPLNPKKISDEWAKMRKKLKFESKYQFYSLKDSGITELLNSGIPAIKVRDQARHHDLKITEKYTNRNQGADQIVQNSEFNF